MNRQGNDVGTQYRSAIFFHSQSQKEEAEAKKSILDKNQIWVDPILTEISPLQKFYSAENYHHNYFNQNGEQPYCQMIINQKLPNWKKCLAEN